MKVDYTLTPRLRVFLKEPFGTLIEGTPQETMSKLRERIRKEKPLTIASVGDIVSQNLHDHNIHPQLTVIDYISLRDQAIPKQPPVEKTIYVKNPQGTITEEAINAIKEAFDANVHTHVVVDGEEDLLTLIAVLYAPKDSFVIYGQPYCGIVVVKASTEKKEQVNEFLKEMKASKS
jgi:uncharacterized protein (UPF0218 family)